MSWDVRVEVLHPAGPQDGSALLLFTKDSLIHLRPYMAAEGDSFGTRDYGRPAFMTLKVLDPAMTMPDIDHAVITALLTRGEETRMHSVHLTGVQAKLSAGALYTLPLFHSFGETVKDLRVEFFTTADLS
tara:strand:- start:983 stop:1372 length:390 start_codon:yes stop_codon:yes gene_type:complete